MTTNTPILVPADLLEAATFAEHSTYLTWLVFAVRGVWTKAEAIDSVRESIRVTKDIFFANLETELAKWEAQA